MPETIITWEGEEAFDKFGFGDGDSWNGTHLVEDALEEQGCWVDANTWGMHNYMIDSIQRGEERWEVDGYKSPREVLPPDLVAFLDQRFNDDYKADE